MDPRICGMRAAPTAALDGFRHPFKLHSYSDLTELDFKWRAYPPAYWICLRLRCTVGGMWHAAHYFVLGSLCFVWLRGAYLLLLGNRFLNDKVGSTKHCERGVALQKVGYL